MGTITAEMIAPCGMDCALCYAYQREKKPCPGCNGEDALKPKHCVKCAVYTCATRRQAGSCTLCSIFPCRRLRELDGRSRKVGISMVENLVVIRDEGMDAFLEAENTRTVCSGCGETICVHEKVCRRCGTNWRR